MARKEIGVKKYVVKLTADERDSGRPERHPNKKPTPGHGAVVGDLDDGPDGLPGAAAGAQNGAWR